MLGALSNYLHDVFVTQFDAWVALGFLAQALFSMRFLVQWIASERTGRSIIPTAFWLFSIGGGVLLFIYLRNLYFVLREKNQAVPAA